MIRVIRGPGRKYLNFNPEEHKRPCTVSSDQIVSSNDPPLKFSYLTEIFFRVVRRIL